MDVVSHTAFAYLHPTGTHPESQQRIAVLHHRFPFVECDPATDADVLRWRLTPIEGAPVEQRVRLGGNKSARVLVRTLQRPAHDPLLVEAVAFAEQLYEDGVVCE